MASSNEQNVHTKPKTSPRGSPQQETWKIAEKKAAKVGKGRPQLQLCKPSKGQKKAFGNYAEARNQIPFPIIRKQLFLAAAVNVLYVKDLRLAGKALLLFYWAAIEKATA